jgi:hypothetical protein
MNQLGFSQSKAHVQKSQGQNKYVVDFGFLQMSKLLSAKQLWGITKVVSENKLDKVCLTLSVFVAQAKVP